MAGLSPWDLKCAVNDNMDLFEAMRAVIVDGQLKVADGKLPRCDEPEAVAEAEEFALWRFARAGLELSPYYP